MRPIPSITMIDPDGCEVWFGPLTTWLRCSGWSRAIGWRAIAADLRACAAESPPEPVALLGADGEPEFYLSLVAQP